MQLHHIWRFHMFQIIIGLLTYTHAARWDPTQFRSYLEFPGLDTRYYVFISVTPEDYTANEGKVCSVLTDVPPWD